nr:MAG TPA: hypothetical protein [Caudoviricetes sp.]
MLLHGEILRVFHSVGSFPFGMHILPSCREDSKRLYRTIICPEYRAECTSLSVLGILFNELPDYFIKELGGVFQWLTTMRKINFYLVLDHLLGSLQREAGLILVIHIVVDVHDKVHDFFVVHTHSSVAPPPRHTAPVWVLCGLVGEFVGLRLRPFVGAVSGLLLRPAQKVGFLHGFLDAPDGNLDEILAVAAARFKVASVFHLHHQALCDVQQGFLLLLGQGLLFHINVPRFRFCGCILPSRPADSKAADHTIIHARIGVYLRVHAQEKGLPFQASPPQFSAQ